MNEPNQNFGFLATCLFPSTVPHYMLYILFIKMA